MNSTQAAPAAMPPFDMNTFCMHTSQFQLGHLGLLVHVRTCAATKAAGFSQEDLFSALL